MKAKFTDLSVQTGEKLIDEEALKQRVDILMSTRRGERRFRPTYGSNLEDLLFEPTSTFILTRIKAHIENIISQEKYLTLGNGSNVFIKDNMTYGMDLVIYSEDLGRTFQYIKDLKVKGAK